MNENAYVGAYWAARQESRAQCADRITQFLLSVQADPMLSTWFLTARSRKASNVALEVGAEAIAEKLKTNNRDVGDEVIQELGFNLSIWNGSLSAPASFAVTCGVFSNYVRNSAVLHLPPAPAPQNATACAPMRGLVEKMAAAFDPDCAVATSTEYLARAGGGMPWEKGGWVVYRRGQSVLVTV